MSTCGGLLTRLLAACQAAAGCHPAPQAVFGSPESLCGIAHWYDQMEQAEAGEGWSSWCERHGIYVAICKELLSTLSATLARPSVEIASGDGRMAALLGIQGTDSNPRGDGVLRLDARQALKTLAPKSVLTCFAPVDAGIERAILAAPSVMQYLYIGPAPPAAPGWTAETLHDLEHVLLTRLDYLTDFTRATHHRRGYAVMLKRDSHAIAP